MKNVLFILFVIVRVFTYAQGNLEFNQVLTHSGGVLVGQFGIKSYSPIQTVPAGKVWKIEWIGASFVSNGTNPSLSFATWGITINTQDVALSTNNAVTSLNAPIWLKAGDNLSFVSGGNGIAGSVKYVFSIIEFNVGP